MNYKESKLILKEVKKAKSILLNCHRGPDPDSIGSALALAEVLKGMGKQTEIICPSEELYDSVDFLKGYRSIRKGVDFEKFAFDKFDLFICLDSSSWGMVAGSENVSFPTIPIVVIDHHVTNPQYGKINLVDENISSAGEIVYRIVADWDAPLTKDVATALLTAIIGDTGAFRFSNATALTFEAAQKLMEKGADRNMIIKRVYANEKFNLLKFWGEVLSVMKIDRTGKFVWSAIPIKTFEKYNRPQTGKETAASSFVAVVEGTDFGFVAIEQVKGVLSISFRGRGDFDTSAIARELGGGGHAAASGAKIEGLSFEKAVDRLLRIARKHAK
jgi:bifunctional oligoribonuclease and PAP phosphatase NrnA